MRLGNLITEHFRKTYGIYERDDYEIEWVNATDLIVSRRIDLVAKLKYVEYNDKKYDMNFISDLYSRHIEAFSYGTYTEPGNDSKNSIGVYTQVFDSLISGIKQEGVDASISIIPVGNNNGIMDGAHRTAVAAYYGMQVPIVRFNQLEANNDTEFFKGRMLDDKYLDFMVTEFCKMKNDVFVACVWPRAKGAHERAIMHDLIKRKARIVYRKAVKLNYNGLRNLVVQVYCDHDWMDDYQDHFSRAIGKVDACYDKNGDVVVYVLQANGIEVIMELKYEIRRLFGVGNHSIHITDNAKESVHLVELVLNQNSIDLLNNGTPDRYVNLNKKLLSFKARVQLNGLSLDTCIVDSSSVMGLYGLRDIEDIDFLAIGGGYEAIEDQVVSNHKDHAHFYGKTISNLILNPECYLVYNDIKFVTLGVLREFKRRRNEKKDQLDVKLIDTALRGNRGISRIVYGIEAWAKRRVMQYRYRVRMATMFLLKQLGLYEIAREVYHNVKGTTIWR